MSQTETVMLFVLGFCAALLLVLLLGRAVWAGIGRWSGWQQTRKIPAAMRDLQAERDSLKAEKAMMARKLDMGVNDMKMRMAEQMAEVSRNRNRLLDLSENLKLRQEEIENLKVNLAARQSHIESLNMQIEENVKAINQAWAKAGERDAELGRLASAHQETLGNLAAREERIANLENETRALREIITIFVPGQGGTQPATGSMSAMEQGVVDPFAPAARSLSSTNMFEERMAWTSPAVSAAAAVSAKQPEFHASNGNYSNGQIASSEIDDRVSNVLSLADRFRSLQKDVKK